MILFLEIFGAVWVLLLFAALAALAVAFMFHKFTTWQAARNTEHERLQALAVVEAIRQYGEDLVAESYWFSETKEQMALLKALGRYMQKYGNRFSGGKFRDEHLTHDAEFREHCIKNHKL